MRWGDAGRENGVEKRIKRAGRLRERERDDEENGGRLTKGKRGGNGKKKDSMQKE